MTRKIIDHTVRFLVGGLFIFSGLIKLNDPIGTSIKLQEYFEVFSVDFGKFFEIFVPASLVIAFILVILEIVLGVAVLISYRMKLTSIVLLALIVFFTFLTFYSAYFDKVTDCGCFGDAIKLTPWESFTKDIILLVLILHIFWYRKKYSELLPKKTGHSVIAGIGILSTFLGIYAIQHLPFIDFRPYKVGNNIQQEMKPLEQPIFEYVFMKDGKEVRSDKYLMESDGYTYQSVNVKNPDKIIPKITDYLVSTVSGEDVTAETFTGLKLLIIIQNVTDVSVKNIDDIRALVKSLDGKIDVMALTSADGASFEAFRHEYQLPVEYFFADATVLKTIVRSNPGITLWKNGTVLGKWHHNDTPSPEEVLNLAVNP